MSVERGYHIEIAFEVDLHTLELEPIPNLINTNHVYRAVADTND